MGLDPGEIFQVFYRKNVCFHSSQVPQITSQPNFCLSFRGKKLNFVERPKRAVVGTGMWGTQRAEGEPVGGAKGLGKRKVGGRTGSGGERGRWDRDVGEAVSWQTTSWR